VARALPVADGRNELAPGTRIDRYEIVRLVAKGGMGRVYLGRLQGRHGFEKLVAIKTILPELAVDPKICTMLFDEVRICCRIQHANVAQILDVGEHRAQPYVVFEWVEGAPLRALFAASERNGRRVRCGPLLRVMASVCEALHAAHELRDDAGRLLDVVHRDVTPANIIVARNGFAKLIDFGVARARDRIAGETHSGVVKGTPQYMAPEQAQGARVDRRADVWGVGAVLYRGLRGSAPFKDRIALEWFIRHVRELPPLPAHVPSKVREIVERAMNRDPAERFSTASEMAFAIERVLRAADTKPSIADLFPPEPLEPRDSRETATEEFAATPAPGPAPGGGEESGDRLGVARRTTGGGGAVLGFRLGFFIALVAVCTIAAVLGWTLAHLR
jgi:serine/threonine-protein kinase